MISFRLFPIAALMLLIFSTTAWADQVTLTTYYPAPFGAYDRIRLVPRTELPLDPYCNDANDIGLMYYDDGLGKNVAGLYVCHLEGKDIYQWVYLTRPFQEENTKPEQIHNAKVVCVKESGKFGVCINNQSFDGTCACQ